MSHADELMLQPVGTEFVSRVGSLTKHHGRCRHANCLSEGVHLRLVSQLSLKPKHSYARFKD